MIAAVGSIRAVLAVLVVGVFVMCLRFNNVVMPNTFKPEEGG